MFRKKLEVTSKTIDIAKTIVNRCLRRGYRITPLKLEKMMVIAYGEYLVKTGQRLFESKISVSESGICIKEIQEKYNSVDEFEVLFADEKVFLFEEENVFKVLIDIYGDKNLLYINDDPRLRRLMENKKIRKNISDKDILAVFVNVPKRPIDTPLLCGASEKAKWIINGCLQKGYDINTFKLEKLLVLAYGECLVKTGTKLFSEKIVIWEAGPMIREVDRDFMRFAISFHSSFYEYYLKLDSEEKLIDSILNKYGNKDGFQLNENVKLKEISKLKNSDGFVSDEDIKRVFEKYML